MRLLLEDEEATTRLAQRLAAAARAGDVLLLDGPLGAGKTSFARGFIRYLARDMTLVVPSPSFTLVQSYATPAGLVWHYDLWRLAGHEPLAELGWDEARDGIVLVEWPDRLGPLSPAEALRVTISLHGAAREAVLEGAARWFDGT